MKQAIANNPARAALFSFFFSSCLFSYCAGWAKIVAAALSLTAAVLFCLPRLSFRFCGDNRRFRVGGILLACGITAGALLSFVSLDVTAAKADATAGKTEYAKVEITGIEKSYPYQTSYRTKVLESDSLRKGSGVLLTVPMDYLERGDVLEGEISYESLGERTSSAFDGRRYYLPDRIVILADADDIFFVSHRDSFSLTEFFSSVRSTLSAKITSVCRRDTGALAAAVLLGDREKLDESIERDFERLGISHLLVVSGTHFSVMIAALEFALRRLRVRPRGRALGNSCFILLFMGVIGFTPSVVRAGLMHLAAQLSLLLWRKPNHLNSYALSGALMIAVNPYSALDISLELSFAATLGCLIFLGEYHSFRELLLKKYRRAPKGRLGRLLEGLVTAFLMTLCVNFLLLPLSWLYFGEISLASYFLNPVAVTAVGALMILTLVYLVLYPLVLPILPLAKAIDFLGGAILACTEKLAGIGGITVSVRYPFVLVFAVLIALCVLTLPFGKRKGRRLLGATALFLTMLLSVGAVSLWHRDDLAVTYTPSGQNDGFVLQSDGKVLLCDISSGSYGFTYSLTDELESCRATEVEALVLTHYHNKHVQSVNAICSREIVRTLYLPTPFTEREEAIALVLRENAEENGIKVIEYACGEEIIFGDATVTLTERTYLSRSTHPVTAVSVTANGKTLVAASGGWNEGSGDTATALGRADIALFLRHSPVYHKEFSLAFDEEPTAVVMDERAQEFCDGGSLTAYGNVIFPRERQRWQLR